jgi:hypothetical protein
MPLDFIRTRSACAAGHSTQIESSQKTKSAANMPLETKDSSTLKSVFERYGVGWVKTDDGSKHVLRSPALDIQAPIDAIWPIVIDVNNYEQLTHGDVKAHIDGELLRGAVISFQMFSNSCTGSLMGTSVERINLIDHEMKIVGWSRHLPISDSITERYHILVPLGPNLTRSYIALKMPGFVGCTSKLLFGKTILKAFDEINQGIKAAAESKPA